MRRITPIWWFTAALFLGLLCPALMQKGMFLDGVTYAAIARNMAEGWGRFSAPYYTATLFPVFYEQPPLAIWLESMPFRFVGDQWWVEGIYCTLLAMVTAWAITALWRMFYPGSGAWKPLWWWICTPVVFWGYQNNMLECTMSLFVLLSVRSSLLAVQKKGEKHLVIAAFWGVCAILSKGPVGLMALAAPWIATMASTSAEGWKGVLLSLKMAVYMTLMLGVLLIVMPEMQDYLRIYWQKQLFPTLSGVREKSEGGRFRIIADLLSQLALPIIISGAAWLLGRKNWNYNRKAVLFFIGMGLAGALPLVITPKQSLHYLIPSIPLFALGVAAFGNEWMERLGNWIGTRPYAGPIGVVLCVAVLAASTYLWGKTKRDKVLVEDTQALSKYLPSGTIFAAPEEFQRDWLTIAYLERYGHFSLEYPGQDRTYYITDIKGDYPTGWSSSDTPAFHGFALYKK